MFFDQNAIKLEVSKVSLIAQILGYYTVFVVVIAVLRQSHSVIQASLERIM